MCAFPAGEESLLSILVLFAPAFATGGEAGLFAATVDLFKEMAHNAEEGEGESGENQEQGDGAPEGAVGRQTRLKARWNERHSRRDEGEEAERDGENVEVAGHILSVESAIVGLR